MASLERLRTCPGLVLFVGVGALCPACIVGRCGAFSVAFVRWCIFLYGFIVFRVCGGILCGVGVYPEGD